MNVIIIKLTFMHSLSILSWFMAVWCEQNLFVPIMRDSCGT